MLKNLVRQRQKQAMEGSRVAELEFAKLGFTTPETCSYRGTISLSISGGGGRPRRVL